MLTIKLPVLSKWDGALFYWRAHALIFVLRLYDWQINMIAPLKVLQLGFLPLEILHLELPPLEIVRGYFVFESWILGNICEYLFVFS